MSYQPERDLEPAPGYQSTASDELHRANLGNVRNPLFSLSAICQISPSTETGSLDLAKKATACHPHQNSPQIRMSLTYLVASQHAQLLVVGDLVQLLVRFVFFPTEVHG
jgi:hypothetical protein